MSCVHFPETVRRKFASQLAPSFALIHDDRGLQRKSAAAAHEQQASSAVPPIVHQVLRSPGQPLDLQTRALMEPRFGHDFSQVRIHADANAAGAASAVGAHAFTSKQDIVFATGKYSPDGESGHRLLAHELAHVVQQSSEAPLPAGIGPLADGWERQADSVANNIAHASGSVAANRNRFDTANLGMTIQRAPDYIKIEANNLAQELQTVIAGATWKEIRKRVYPKESAAGIQRSKERRAGTREDLTGLGSLLVLEHFTKAIRALQTKWTSLGPEKRVSELGAAANVELTNVEVPKFLEVKKEKMEGKGFFEPSEWKYTISEELVTSNSLNNDDAAEVSNTTLHESRHAEQHFLSARHSAGVNKLDAAALAKEQEIPEPIARQAAAKKFDAKTDPKVATLGERMYQAHTTDNDKNQAISDDTDAAIKELNKRRFAAERSLRDLNQSASTTTISDAKAKRDALQAQITEVEKKYALYRKIPYEADAHEVGDAAGLAFAMTPP